MSTAAQQNSPHTGQAPRTTVVADMSMSLDGLAADPGDGVDVFAWCSKPRPCASHGTGEHRSVTWPRASGDTTAPDVRQ